MDVRTYVDKQLEATPLWRINYTHDAISQLTNEDSIETPTKTLDNT